MDERMTLQEEEDTFIDDLNTLGDWFMQHEYLLEISAGLPRVEKGERTDRNRIPGCQSGVWLVLSAAEGRVYIRGDSDALIVRGFLSVFVSLLNGRTPAEILGYSPRFIEETGIKKQIASDRFQGMQAVLARIKEYAAKIGKKIDEKIDKEGR